MSSSGSKYQSGARHPHSSQVHPNNNNNVNSNNSHNQPKRRRPQLYYLFLVILVVFVTFVILIFSRHTHLSSSYFSEQGKTFSKYVPLTSAILGGEDTAPSNHNHEVEVIPSKQPTTKLRVPVTQKSPISQKTSKPTIKTVNTVKTFNTVKSTVKEDDTQEGAEEEQYSSQVDGDDDDDEEEGEVAYSEADNTADDNEAEEESSYSAAVDIELEEQEEEEEGVKQPPAEAETTKDDQADIEDAAAHQVADGEEEVAYTDLTHEDPSISTAGKTVATTSSNVWQEQQHMLSEVRRKLAAHPMHSFYQSQQAEHSVEDVLFFMHAQPQCQHVPLFTSMANVFSELYWQMIENFIYTMVKFDLSDCAVMVCVSDSLCMQRCREAAFPCVDFQYKDFHPERVDKPSALEQIAELKLLHIPKALKRGVDVLMIDLDVGFLTSPMEIVKQIEDEVDVYVQKDIAYVMNRTLAGWKTWYTEPLPNIGVFYVRGNEKTVNMFRDAWADYQTMNPKLKTQPGKDQNKVAAAMRSARFQYKLKWKHFSAENIVLLDMVYKYSDPRFELGGRAASAILQPQTASSMMKDPALLQHRYQHVRKMVGKKTQDVGRVTKDSVVQVVHTTCYEQKVKVNGLKTANAYWNPFYYDASRRTLTKPLVFVTNEQLAHEVRSLLYLAYASNRSLIIPNVLGHSVPHDQFIEYFEDRALWPWFRIPFYMKNYAYHHIKVVEPSYYWRIARDYFTTDAQRKYIPSPVLVNLTATMPGKTRRKALTIRDIETVLLSPAYSDASRLVLHLHDDLSWPAEQLEERAHHLKDWAQDSIGLYDAYDVETKFYQALPRLNAQKYSVLKYFDVAPHLMQQVRLCKDIFEFDHGNRSCFDKCD